MKNFHNTLSKYFLKSVDLIKKQNWGQHMDHVYATTTLNLTILSGEWDYDNQHTISKTRTLNNDYLFIT